MLRILTKNIHYGISLKDKIKQRMAQIISNQGGVLRNPPTTKQRKYKNIQITQDYKKLDSQRKKQRYQNIKKRQLLLQKQLTSQTQLLNASQTQQIKSQIQAISKFMKDNQKQIQQLNTIIQSQQAQYMVVQGHMKLTILNHVRYLQVLHKFNAGSALHPQTIAAIQNVHYCVNHNLPLSRIKLYEIMPQYFQAQIGQLQQSIQRLIKQKNIFLDDPESKSSIKFFQRTQLMEYQPKYFDNMVQDCLFVLQQQIMMMLKDHKQLLDKVQQGKTPFRNWYHMTTVMLSNLPIKYLPQQQAFRKVLFQINDLVKQWDNFKRVTEKKIQQLIHRYVPPPPYIQNHPLLSQKWQQIMKKFTNPVPIEQTPFLIHCDPKNLQLNKKIQAQIRRIVTEQYDPIFVEQMNKDRSLIDKKKQQVDFFTMTANVVETMKALQQKSKQDEQIFKSLPKPNPFFLSQKKKNLLHMNQLTRILWLNFQNKHKYNLQFFSKWLGIDQQQLKNILTYVSYIRVPLQTQKDKLQNVQFQILKFEFL